MPSFLKWLNYRIFPPQVHTKILTSSKLILPMMKNIKRSCVSHFFLGVGILFWNSWSYNDDLARVEDAKIEEEMIELNPHPIIMEGIDRVKPTVDFRIIERTQTSRDAIPIPIEDSKAIQYAIQWLVEATHVADPSRRFCTQVWFKLEIF